MRIREKTVAAILAAAISATPFVAAGCGKKTNTADIISADTPWYSLSRFVAEDHQVQDKIMTFFDMYYGGRIEDKLLFYAVGHYLSDEEADPDEYSVDDDLNAIDVYSLDGTLINSIDLNQYICPDEYGIYSIGWDIIGDQIVVTSGNTEYIIDEENGEVVSETAVSSDDEPGYKEGIYYLGDYIATVYYDFTDTETLHKILIRDPQGNETLADLSNTISTDISSYISGMMYLGDGKALFSVCDGITDNNMYLLDLDTGDASEYTEDINWFKDDFRSAAYIADVGNVIINQYGIRKLDFETCDKPEVFSFDSCNINRYDAGNLELLDMTDDMIIMSGMKYTGNEYEVYILTKEDTNPNVGKKILVAATLDTFDYAVCEAVCDFNETNSDYFIRLESKYSTLAKYMNGELDYYSGNVDEEYLQSSGELSNMLMMDLLSADGPDIILNGASFTQLNSSDCLMDLSDVVDDGGLFANVIEASKSNGRLYQLPLSVNIACIIADRSDVDEDRIGFTFDQYGEYVSDGCHGRDPIGDGKLEFFATVMNSVCDQCIADGNANFDNEGFRALAEYISENVNDVIETPDESDANVRQMITGTTDQRYFSDLTFSCLMDSFSEKIDTIRIMGLPSTDGRGPGISIASSVAISASTGEEEACKEFVRTLISDEIQYETGRTGQGAPVSISAFVDTAYEMIDEYNVLYESYSRSYSNSELRLLGLPCHTVDHAVADEYKATLESCSYINSTDPSIMIIVREEMSSYFLGQKDLDEVISLINDRTQLFLDERD